MKKHRVLGIDPGVKCGIAILNSDGTVDSVDTWNGLQPYEILKNYNLAGVRLAVIENAFMGPNSKNALGLARKIGRWQEALESRGIQCVTPYASEWQSALLPITNKTPGKDRKDLAISLCRNMFDLCLDEHSADALLLAHYGLTEVGRCGE